ncbi:MAG: class I SAM-dependent methyltransferase [Myxococcota bacterium]
MLLAYLRGLAVHVWRSPYRWPRSFEAVRARRAAGVDERELVYGETPVFTAWWILRRAKLGSDDAMVDLSAGRGRPLFGARLRTPHVKGYELIEERVAPVRRSLTSAGITLLVADGTEADLSHTDVALITWTGFSDELVRRFERAARTLPDGARFVAIDRPMSDSNGFEELGQFSVLCTWGIVPVWIYVRRLDSAQHGG